MNKILNIINEYLNKFISEMKENKCDIYFMIVNKDFYLIDDLGKIEGFNRRSLLNEFKNDNQFKFVKNNEFSYKKIKAKNDRIINVSFFKINEDIFIVSVANDEDMLNNYIKTFISIIIKFANKINEMEHEIDLVKKKSFFERKVLETMQVGYIFLNKEGIIKNINAEALEIIRENPSIVGTNLREITQFEPDIYEVLANGQGWQDKEFIINLRKRKNVHLLKSCVPIYDENNEIIGALDILRDIKNVKKFVNKLSGSQSMFCFNDIVAESENMKEIIKFAKKMSKYDSSILIEGESGTGKELLAHAIHNESERKNGPFITIDCTSLPNNLVESELFGYVEGAFTGARKGGRPGKFEMAEGGTIFLDEIGELPLEMQKKLLRVLQFRTITRIGDYETIPVDIRIIAATNRDLEAEIIEKNFRKDLFYRINVINIKVSPLKNRKEDIIPISKYFIMELGKNIGKTGLSMENEYINALIEYEWPGNVRQLKNAIERAVNLVEGNVIKYNLLPNAIKEKLETSENQKNIDHSLEDVEKKHINEVLEKYNWNKSKVAEELNMSRSTLYAKIRKYALE